MKMDIKNNLNCMTRKEIFKKKKENISSLKKQNILYAPFV